ncbi:MAG TPA: hypothetical protein VNT79_11260 [Phycisphaerae bacterium]|nr:hypothetical protein [Phycisphaerae bacterium]
MSKRSSGTFLQRSAYLLLSVIFCVAGAPNLTVPGLSPNERAEHESKPPQVEEEVRTEIALPESQRSRSNRENGAASHASSMSHTPQAGTHLPTRGGVSHRRVLDKQNGLGAFLRV